MHCALLFVCGPPCDTKQKEHTPGALLLVGGQLEQQNKKNTRALLFFRGKYSWSQHELRE